MKMTPEQWNGLVALMRAIAVAAAEPGAISGLELKRQAGACEANVRKMFVDDIEGPMIGEQRHVGEAVEVFTVDGWKRIPIGALPPAPASTDLERLLLVTGDVCKFLDDVRTGYPIDRIRVRAGSLQHNLELARVGARQADDAGKTEAQKDTGRAQRAGRMIVDERAIETEAAAIMVTLEHTIAAVLLALYDDPRKAAGMLNEALAPGVETRLAGYGTKSK